MRLFCIVPTWKDYPTEAVESIKMQIVQPDACVAAIDECTKSPDGRPCNVYKLFGTYDRIYAACNIISAINYLKEASSLKDDDIICLIDGDDKLVDKHALLTVVGAHSAGAWVTYGSYYNKSEINSEYAVLRRGSYRNDENYRKGMWRASHLKTFRYGLYRRLKKDWYLGPDGEPLRVCSDLALMFPMLEMAGKEHVKHINKALYIYNDMSPDNDHKVRGKEQKDIEYWLRHQTPYQKIHSLSVIGENLK